MPAFVQFVSIRMDSLRRHLRSDPMQQEQKLLKLERQALLLVLSVELLLSLLQMQELLLLLLQMLQMSQSAELAPSSQTDWFFGGRTRAILA